MNNCDDPGGNDEDKLMNVLEDAIVRTTKIVKYTYYFIRSYMMDCYLNGICPVEMNRNTIWYIYSLVSVVKLRESSKVAPANAESITEFYNKVFRKIEIEEVARDNLISILDYECTTIITSIENNIKNNFIRHVNKYINIYIEHNRRIFHRLQNITDRQYRIIVNTIKKDVFSFEKPKSHKDFHKTIAKLQKSLFDKKADFTKKNKNILYDVKASPQKYLFTFYKIISYYRLYNATKDDTYSGDHSDDSDDGDDSDNSDDSDDRNKSNINKPNKSDVSDEPKPEIKLFNITPLRTSLIPTHITLDIAGLIAIFGKIITCPENLKKITNENVSRNYLRNNAQKYRDEIWNVFFNMPKLSKYYKSSGYTFNHMIRTDGFACSLQYIYNPDGENIKTCRFQKGVNKQQVDAKKRKEQQDADDTKYIDDILTTNKNAFDGKNIVCIDPNKGNLIYAGRLKTDEEKQNSTERDNKKVKTFRYTNNQRRKELKTKEYAKRRKKSEDAAIVTHNNKRTTVSNVVKLKSKYNTKELEDKIEMNELEEIDRIIQEHYESDIYRKLKMHSYINKQRSVSHMINRFKEQMGKQEDTVVVIGDNGLKDVVVKGLCSTLSKGLIEIFKRNKYETYVIDEFRTSKLCNGCMNELSRFMKYKSNKPTTRGRCFLSNALLRCQSSAHACNVTHNRDRNAATNMLKIVKHYQLTGERLLQYSREFKPNTQVLAIV